MFTVAYAYAGNTWPKGQMCFGGNQGWTIA